MLQRESPQPRLRTGLQGHRDMTLAVRCQLRLYPRSRCDSRIEGPQLTTSVGQIIPPAARRYPSSDKHGHF